MKHLYKIQPHERKWRKDRVQAVRCPCGKPAITNASAGCAACEDCLRIEQSFAEAELKRSERCEKLGGGLGKYVDWYLNAATFSPALHCRPLHV